MDPSSLAEYGIAAMSLGVLVYAIRQQFNFMCNHVRHNTESNLEMAKALARLKESIDSLGDYLRNRLD